MATYRFPPVRKVPYFYQGYLQEAKTLFTLQGLQTKKPCNILVCPQPWRPDAPQRSTASRALSTAVTADSLGIQADNLMQAVASFKRAHYALTAALRFSDPKNEINLGCCP